MKKSISTVIATLLMLIITIALASVAYVYITGIFTARAAKTISLIDTTCKANVAYYITVRNLDATRNITAADEIIVRVDDVPIVTISWNPPSIAPNGGVSVGTITNPAGGAEGTTHRVKVIGPSNVEQGVAYC